MEKMLSSGVLLLVAVLLMVGVAFGESTSELVKKDVDLETAATGRLLDWGNLFNKNPNYGRPYNGGGYSYNPYGGTNYYGSSGSYPGVSSGGFYPSTGYGYGGYGGYGGGYGNSGSGGYGGGGYGTNVLGNGYGYGGSGYGGGYGSGYGGGYGSGYQSRYPSVSGLGGYGGYAGNGGLQSYYGYDAGYTGSRNLGYGYYPQSNSFGFVNRNEYASSPTGFRGYE